MEDRIRVRFAPSPTGPLHVGNARTALFNFLFARQHSGAFILRVEDTDRERSRREFEEAALEDLRWLGLEWDEGPDRGGDFGPYRQSERLDLYRRRAAELIEKGLAYWCYCTDQELEEKRKNLLARGIPPRYDGRCRSLKPEEERSLVEAGRLPSLRFRIPAGSVDFEDLVKGAMSFDGRKMGDFVILRSDGTAAYNFAAVVDDHLMQISHVIRGEDHLANTSRQVLLYRALGYPLPRFAHLSMILGPDRAPLSKRHGATAVSSFRDEGYLPGGLANYLALLGWSAGNGKEIFSLQELVSEFSLDRLSRSPAIFSPEKLKWVNRAHLKAFRGGKALELARPFLLRSDIHPDERGPSWWIAALEAVWEEIDTLSELPERLGFLFEGARAPEPEAERLLGGEAAGRLIRELKEELQSVEEITPGNYRSILSGVSRRAGVSGRNLYLPLRALATGRTHGPELEKVFVLLGKQEILERADSVLRKTDRRSNDCQR